MSQRDDESTNGSRLARMAAGPARLAGPLQILLANRSLAALVGAFGAVTIAEWSFVTALAVDVLRRDGTIAVGFVGFRLLFAAFGGLLALPSIERRPGARKLTVVAAARAAIVGAAAAMAATGVSAILLLVLVCVDGLVSGAYRPAQSTMLPVMARSPRELAASAAGISIVKTLAQAIGATSGGLLLTVTTPTVVFAGSAALFLLAALITIRFTHIEVPAPIAMQPSSLKERGRATVEAIREPHVPSLLTVSGLRTLVRGMWIAIAVIASIRLLHSGNAGVGLLMMAAGIGSLAAVPLSGGLIRHNRLGLAAGVALVLCGLPFAAIAAVPRLDLAFAVIVVWGVGMAVADVATLSLLYRILDVPLLPRVTALIESSKLALEGLGGLLAPLLISAISIRWTLAAAAVPLPLVVVLGWRMFHRLDASAAERTTVLALLHGAPCLRPLDMASLGFLATAVVPIRVPEGTEVVRQGDPGDRFFVVKEGSADVSVDGYAVSRVEQGGSFGERSLLRDVPRTATVRARGPMQLLTLSRDAFLAGLTGQGGVGGGAGGLGEPWPRHDLVGVFGRLGLFSHLDSRTLRDLARHAVVDEWPSGSTIVQQGNEGDRFFVLLDGGAVVSIDGRRVGDIRPGDQFGEISLLHDVPRTATVTASSAGATTVSLGRDAFTAGVRDRVLLG